MKKAILSAFAAFISLLCGIVSFTAFVTSCEPLLALLAVLFGMGVIAAIGYGLDDTKIADKMSNFFAEKGGDK